jgi:translocation and assembly module TamB
MTRPTPKQLAGYLLKYVRIAIHWLVRLGLILLFVGFGLLFYLQTPPGRQTLGTFVAEQLSGPDYKVTIGLTRGVPPRSLFFENIELSDKKGVWARIGGVDILINPLALLDGTVEVDALRFRQVEVLRQPELPDKPDLKPFSIPDLPVAIHVKAFMARDVRLDAQVANVVADVTAFGDGLWQRHKITLNFDLDRTDVASDHIAARLNMAQNADPLKSRLNVDLDLYGKPGGIFAGLAGLKPKDGIVAALKGDGLLDGWAGNLTARAEGLAALDGRVKVRNGDPAVTVGFVGKVDLAPLMSKEAITRFGKDVAVDAGASLARGMPVGYDLKARNAALALTMESPADKAAKKRLWRVTAKILDPSYFKHWVGPVTFRDASFAGVMEGSFHKPELTFNAHFAALGMPNLNMRDVAADVNISLSKELSGWSGKGLVKGRLARLQVEAGSPATITAFDKLGFALDGSFDPGKHMLTLRSFDLQGSGVKALGSGQLSFNDGATALKISAALADLRHFQNMTGLAMQGSLALDANIARNNGAAPLQITGLAHTKDFKPGSAFAASVLGPEINVRFDGVRDSRKDGFTGKAQLNGKLVEAAISGSLMRGSLEGANYHLAVTDTPGLEDVVGLPMPPSLRIDGAARGSFSDISTEGRLTAGDLVRRRLKLTGINGRFAVKNLGSASKGANGSVSFDMKLPAGALHAAARLATYKGNVVRIEGITITAPETEVNGYLTMAPGVPATGKLSGSAKDLKKLARQFDLDAEGNAAFLVVLKNQGGRQYVEATAEGHKIVSVLPNRDIIKMDGLQLAASGYYDGVVHDLNVDLALNNIRAATAEIKAFHLKAKGQGRAAHYNMSIDGNFRGQVSLQSEGDFIDRKDGFNLTVENFGGAVYGRTVKLMKPFYVNKGVAELTAAPLDLTLGGGHLTGVWRQDTKGLIVDGEAKNFDLILLSLLYPEAPINGAGDATARIKVANGLPAGEMTVALRNVTSALPGRGDMPPLQASVTALLGRKALIFNGRMTAADKLQATFDGNLPLKVDPKKQTLSVAENDPLQAKLNWQGEMAPLWNMTPPTDHRVAGNLNGTLMVAGTFANPSLHGAATISNGAYDSRSLGLAARDIKSELSLEGRRVTVASASGNDAGGGTFKASGWVDLLPLEHFPASFDLVLDKARIIRITDLKAAVSAALGYTRVSDHSTLSGNADVQQIDGNLMKRMALEIPEIEVKEINLPATGKGRLTTRIVGQRKIAPYPTNLNVHLKAARRVFVRGRGLDSEWKGDVDVEGTVDKPIISGDMTVVRGTFTLASKEFTITDGTLTFIGDDKVDPMVNIKAEYKMTELTAYLELTGYSSKPKFALTSTPDLPQEEILSRILFGTSVAQLGPLEAVQLASAVASLSGSGGSLDLVNFARSRLGLDRLRFQSAADRTAGTLISGGKYITNNIYFEVETATGTGQSKARVKVNITDHLSVESDVGSGNTSGVGIKWEKDY